MIPRWTRQLLLIPALLCLLTSISWAQEQDAEVWQATGGPVAFVTHIAADPTAPDFLFSFISSSVQRNPDQTQTIMGSPTASWAPYFSVDGGEHWQPASNDLAGMQPTALAILPGNQGSIIWVGTKQNGVWRSRNGGRTWRPALIPGLQDQQTLSIIRDARHRLHLLTVDNSRYPVAHLYSSRDNGYNWSHRALMIEQERIQARAKSLLADPFDGNRLYLVTQNGLLITNDAGFSWRRITLPLPDDATKPAQLALATDATQRGRLYLAQRVQMSSGRHRLLIFLSLNNGVTWQLQPASFTPLAGSNPEAEPIPQALFVNPLVRRQLLLATDCGLWLSPDGGLTWRSAGTDLSGVSVNALLFHPRRRGDWIAAGAGGIWRTDTFGGSWRPITQGLPPASSIHQIFAFDDANKTLLALNGGFLPEDALAQPLWRSEDGGATWMPARRGLEGVHLRRLIPYPYAPNTAFALTVKGLARTDNSGRTWLHRPLDDYPLAMAADPSGPNIYLATAQGLLRSTDKGDSWVSVFAQNGVVAVTVDASGAVFLAAYGQDSTLQLWSSQTAGLSWRQVGELPIHGAVNLFAHPHQANLLAATAPWQGLFVTVDGGETWEQRKSGIPTPARWRGGNPQIANAPNILALFMDPKTGIWWASRDGGGVYKSIDNGSHWQDATTDLGDALLLSFARGPSSILAGASNLGVVQWQNPAPTAPPENVDARIEIFWPHDFAPVTLAQEANLGLRLYRDHSLEPPPCAWSPNVVIFAARDAEPLRRVDMAEHRNMAGHPFPVWMLNDLDVTWANEAGRQLIYMAQVAPGLAQSRASVWIHAADARTKLPDPPQPSGLAPAGVSEMDGRIFLVWPHDETGRYVPPEVANLANVSAVLYQRDTLLALAAADLPDRVWLVGAPDNQVGRRLAMGKKRIVSEAGLRYTVFDFNDIDVSLARDPLHHWSFWLEAPGADLTSNVWVHGSDARTLAPRMVEPIVGCTP